MSEANKYNYHDYKARGIVLPEDINSDVFVVSDKLDPTGKFTELLKKAQTKKLFGDAHFINPKTLKLMGSFEFHNGVCKMFKLLEFVDDTHSHFIRTIINEKVNFKREHKN